MLSSTSQKAIVLVGYPLPISKLRASEGSYFEDMKAKFLANPDKYLRDPNRPDIIPRTYFLYIHSRREITIDLLDMEGKPEEVCYGMTTCCLNDWLLIVQCCYDADIGNTVNLYKMDQMRNEIWENYSSEAKYYYFTDIESIAYKPILNQNLQKQALVSLRNITHTRAIFRGQFVGQGILSSSIHLILLLEPCLFHLVYFHSSGKTSMPSGILHSNQRYSPDPDTELYSYVQLNSTEFILNGWNFCAKYKLSL